MVELEIHYTPYEVDIINNLMELGEPIKEANLDDVLFTKKEEIYTNDNIYLVESIVTNAIHGPVFKITIRDGVIICDRNRFDESLVTIEVDYVLGDTGNHLQINDFNIKIIFDTPIWEEEVEEKSEEPPFWEHDQLVCKKCKGNTFTFDWKFKDEASANNAIMGHRGYGLMLDWAEMTCATCGAKGYYDDSKVIGIKILVAKGKEKKKNVQQ